MTPIDSLSLTYIINYLVFFYPKKMLKDIRYKLRNSSDTIEYFKYVPEIDMKEEGQFVIPIFGQSIFQIVLEYTFYLMLSPCFINVSCQILE